MRHRRAHHTFNRDTKSRKALLMNLAFNLVENGHVTTTTAKAKELRRIADKLVSTAKGGDVIARRKLHEFFGKRSVANKLVDQVAPAMQDRDSGFTTLIVVGNRAGDNSLMSKVAWVNEPLEKTEAVETTTKKK